MQVVDHIGLYKSLESIVTYQCSPMSKFVGILTWDNRNILCIDLKNYKSLVLIQKGYNPVYICYA